MKIIEAMKKIKDLQIKAEEIKKKVSQYCAIQSIETPLYGKDQAQKIQEWCQSYSDILKEILRLRVSIQKTNINTNVTIELGDKNVTKSIAEWIHRRRDLAGLERSLWESIGDRGLKEGLLQNSQGERVDVRIVRFYEPTLRDTNVELFRSEPNIIDRTLEVTNAVTDIVN